MKAPPHRILLIDDDLDQQFLSTKALRQVMASGSSINLAGSGNEAIAYMIGEGKFADRSRYPFPTVVITDLNMPDGDCFDVLEFMQANVAWSVVPRIVFSASEDDDDVRTAFQLGASAFHLKPGSLDEIEAQIAQIVGYWATNRIPPAGTSGRLDETKRSRTRGNRYPQSAGGEAMKRPEPA